jgi:hypothetical protein
MTTRVAAEKVYCKANSVTKPPNSEPSPATLEIQPELTIGAH